MNKKEDLKNIKFEDALKKLETIVAQLENGEVALEESLSLYEEGIGLFKHCSGKLEEARKKVEILSKKGADGKLQAQDFTGEEESVSMTPKKSAKAATDDIQDEIPF